MKNSVLFLCITMFIFGLVIQPGCKTSESVVQYSLMVTVSTGVSGLPLSGTYTYDEGQIISYSYTLETGYGNLAVTLDGTTVANSGVVSMNSNHILNVTAEELFDVRDDWEGQYVDDDGYGLHYHLSLTFSGGYYTGIVSGTMGAGGGWPVSGVYTISDGQIDFDLTSEGISCTGTIDDDNHMSGTGWWAPSVSSGIWNLERQ